MFDFNFRFGVPYSDKYCDELYVQLPAEDAEKTANGFSYSHFHHAENDLAFLI